MWSKKYILCENSTWTTRLNIEMKINAKNPKPSSVYFYFSQELPHFAKSALVLNGTDASESR